MGSRVSASVEEVPRELKLFFKVLVGTILLSLLDAFARWPLQGAKRAFSALLLIHPLVDITCYWWRFKALHTIGFFQDPGQPWAYPPACAFIYRIVYSLATYNTLRLVYLALGVTLLAVAAFIFGKALQHEGLVRQKAFALAVAVPILSWPIYFSFERGNIESFLWLILACALAFYIRVHWQWAAIATGFVAAFKMYPILFLGLFLPTRRYREVAQALLSAGITTLAGLLFLDWHLRLSAKFILAGIRFFVQNYSAVFSYLSNGYDHSLWALLKLPLHSHPAALVRFLSIYTPLAGVLALAYYVTVLWNAPRFNQLAAICVLMVILPSTSFDYTLQALYIPFAWLCVATIRARRLGYTLPGASAYFFSFALVFGPLVFIRNREFTFNGQAKALVLLALLYLLARFPIADIYTLRSAVQASPTESPLNVAS